MKKKFDELFNIDSEGFYVNRSPIAINFKGSGTIKVEGKLRIARDVNFPNTNIPMDKVYNSEFEITVTDGMTTITGISLPD